jgi:hypothetical protein
LARTGRISAPNPPSETAPLDCCTLRSALVSCRSTHAPSLPSAQYVRDYWKVKGEVTLLSAVGQRPEGVSSLSVRARHGTLQASSAPGAANAEVPGPSTIWIYRVGPRATHYLQFVLETYDGGATPTTLEARTGLIQLSAPPGA